MNKIVLMLICCILAAGAAEPTWRFSSGPEFPGAKGKLENGILTGDFTAGGYYVGAYCDLKDPKLAQKIRFRVRGEVQGLEIRLIGADRQCHQLFLEIQASGEFQELTVPVDTRSERHWGGENDGVIRQPLISVGLILRKQDLREKRGTVEFRDFQLLPAGTIRSFPLGTPGWDFRSGAEFPGAKGALTGEAGKLRLDADFTAGGVYVSANYRLPRQAEAETFSFTVTGPLKRIGVRFRDASEQVHQHFQVVEPGTEQTLRFPVTGSPKSHWGGENDGKFKQPLKEIMIVVHKGDITKDNRGTVELSALRLESAAPLEELLAWRVPAPERLFRRPGDTSAVEIAAALPVHSEELLNYRYCDYTGREVASGKAIYNEVSGILSAPPPPGRGFYELIYPALGICAGVAVDDPPPAQPDPFFGADTSLSWGRGPSDMEGFRTYLRILRENGITWARDRLDWRTIEPKQGEFKFDNRFDTLRRAAAAEGVNVLDVFHDAPVWTGAAQRSRSNKREENPYPANLFQTGESFVAMAKRWQNVRALEVWNEPEFSGNGFPPEYVIALTKAISRSFADRGVDTTVVGGVITTPRPDTGYYETFVESGLLEDCDVMSFHSYSDTPVMERLIDFLRGVEAKYNSPRAGIPIWITETGKPWKRGGPRASVPGDIRSASEIAAKAAEMRALGLAKYFAFSFKYYDELHNNFGMMDSNHTPMRSMAAYARAVRLLSHRQYAGDLKDTGAVRARVFTGNGETIACLYPGVDGARTLTLPDGLPLLSAEGADGRKLALNGRELPVPDGIAWLRLPQDLPERFLDRATNAMRLTRIAASYKPSPRAAKALLLQPATDVAPLLPTIFGFYAPDYDSVEFRVKVSNFGTEALQFTPGITLPAKARLLTEPENMTIPPRGDGMFAFRVALDPEVTEPLGFFSGITVSDRNGNATPLRFSVKPYRRDVVKALPFSASAGDENWRDISGGQNWSTWPGGSETPNIGAKFRYFHTPGGFVLQVRVKDKSHNNAFPAPEAWRGDSVQFTLQTREKGRTPENWCEITAADCADGSVLYRHRGGEKPDLLQTSKLNFRMIAKGEYLYEITLDAAELRLKPGTDLGSALLVNSNSGNGREGYLSWGRGIAEGMKTDALFNAVEIER